MLSVGEQVHTVQAPTEALGIRRASCPRMHKGKLVGGCTFAFVVLPGLVHVALGDICWEGCAHEHVQALAGACFIDQASCLHLTCALVTLASACHRSCSHVYACPCSLLSLLTCPPSIRFFLRSCASGSLRATPWCSTTSTARCCSCTPTSTSGRSTCRTSGWPLGCAVLCCVGPSRWTKLRTAGLGPQHLSGASSRGFGQGSRPLRSRLHAISHPLNLTMHPSTSPSSPAQTLCDRSFV